MVVIFWQGLGALVPFVFFVALLLARPVLGLDIAEPELPTLGYVLALGISGLLLLPAPLLQRPLSRWLEASMARRRAQGTPITDSILHYEARQARLVYGPHRFLNLPLRYWPYVFFVLAAAFALALAS